MDIVERLRHGVNRHYGKDPAGLLSDSADEIERLRKELADLLADVKACSCKQRENDINQLFEELSK